MFNKKCKDESYSSIIIIVNRRIWYTPHIQNNNLLITFLDTDSEMNVSTTKSEFRICIHRPTGLGQLILGLFCCSNAGFCD